MSPLGHPHLSTSLPIHHATRGLLGVLRPQPQVGHSEVFLNTHQLPHLSWYSGIVTDSVSLPPGRDQQPNLHHTIYA